MDLMKLYKGKSTANYVSITCLSALSLHLEVLHHIDLCSDNSLKIVLFNDSNKMFIDHLTSRGLNLLPQASGSLARAFSKQKTLEEQFSLITRLGGII
jgi:DNA mismatch repair ATPase MutS